jgi:hypothetical protein
MVYFHMASVNDVTLSGAKGLCSRGSETLRSRRTLTQSDIVLLNQEKHHAKQTFKDEYMDFLQKFEINHDAKYLFEWIQ